MINPLLPSAPRERDVSLHRRAARCAALLLAVLIAFALPRTPAFAAAPEGVWQIDEQAAVQIFECSDLLCGRILWLQTPRNSQGDLKLDKNNRQPELRHRGLCGMTMIWGLRSGEPGRWTGGQFYNPDDGTTYNVSIELKSPERLTARIYQGIAILGETKTLFRVAHGTS